MPPGRDSRPDQPSAGDDPQMEPDRTDPRIPACPCGPSRCSPAFRTARAPVQRCRRRHRPGDGHLAAGPSARLVARDRTLGRAARRLPRACGVGRVRGALPLPPPRARLLPVDTPYHTTTCVPGAQSIVERSQHVGVFTGIAARSGAGGLLAGTAPASDTASPPYEVQLPARMQRVAAAIAEAIERMHRPTPGSRRAAAGRNRTRLPRPRLRQSRAHARLPVRPDPWPAVAQCVRQSRAPVRALIGNQAGGSHRPATCSSPGPWRRRRSHGTEFQKSKRANRL